MAHLITEVVYRGIFQKNLASRITRGIVLSARKAGRWGIAFGRYGDSPQRNGVPAKDFAIVADTKEELEQHMARYEPKELHVTICVDDTLTKGVESWAWYGLQPLNRLLLPDGHLLVTSTQRPADLLRDIHKKDAVYNLWILRGKASFSGLWVYKEDHIEVRVLGALAKIAPQFLTLDAVCQAIREAEWGSDLKVESARKAYERIQGRPVPITEGNPETPYSFELPRWWEMREGVSIPSLPIGKPIEGGKGYRPERSQVFKKFSSRTMRPVIDFETCVKCTLCWLQCPDSCFDVMPDGLYDANMESCCGCGVCEAVCPVHNCITMVNEAVFEDNASQWEMWRRDKDAYKVWLAEKIRDKAHTVRSHGFRYRGQYEEELAAGELELGGLPVTEGIPGENAAEKGLPPGAHMHQSSTSIVTGVAEAPGA
ncbi:MAG TPA: 4Fe-4S dicluster-binding protein [Methylomirabilota bacterium]|nr:4Fe-4S dicluster-binding protein [Methylomirabilota bacterium]